MGQQRKLPERETLAKHIADGMSLDHIAETYGCVRHAVRQRLIHYGLVLPNRKAPDPEQVKARQLETGVPARLLISIDGRKITFQRNTFVPGAGVVLRSISVPRNSMHLTVLARRYPELAITRLEASKGKR